MNACSNRIYLDNAATTWPKPEAVYEAVDHYQREIGGPNGRSGYREALESNRIVERARQGVAELIGADDPLQIVFGFNGTDVLNLAIRGVVRPGDHVVTTVCDHNSVLRPLRALAEQAGRRGQLCAVRRRRVLFRRTMCARRCGPTRGSWPSCMRRTSPARFSRSKRSAASSASTARCSWSTRPSRWATCRSMCRSSTSICWPRRDTKDCSGRWAPACSTFVRASSSELEPLRYGGTGTRATKIASPTSCPTSTSRAITICSGLAGLVAACEFLATKTIAAMHAHHTALTARLLDGCSEIDGLTIHGPQSTANRTSVVSITVDGYDPQELAAMLESSHRIQCRAGLALCTADARSARHDRRRRHAAPQPRLRDDARRNRSACAAALEEVASVSLK